MVVVPKGIIATPSSASLFVLLRQVSSFYRQAQQKNGSDRENNVPLLRRLLQYQIPFSNPEYIDSSWFPLLRIIDEPAPTVNAHLKIELKHSVRISRPLS